jgi:hypothetical protein
MDRERHASSPRIALRALADVYSFPMHALGLATVTRRHVMLHRSLEAH